VTLHVPCGSSGLSPVEKGRLRRGRAALAVLSLFVLASCGSLPGTQRHRDSAQRSGNVATRSPAAADRDDAAVLPSKAPPDGLAEETSQPEADPNRSGMAWNTAVAGTYKGAFTCSGSACGSFRSHDMSLTISDVVSSGFRETIDIGGNSQTVDVVHSAAAVGWSSVYLNPDKCRFKPSLLMLALPPRPTREWSQDSSCTVTKGSNSESEQIHQHSQIVGRETVDVAGRQVRCWLVRRSVTSTYQAPGGITLSSHSSGSECWALQWGLVVKSETISHNSGQTMTLKWSLASLGPA